MSRTTNVGKRTTGSERTACCPGASVDCCPEQSARVTDPTTASADAIKRAVRESYANRIRTPRRSSCCGPEASAAQRKGYTAEQLEGLPEELHNSTYGCGNPVAFSDVQEGQAVLDIGSGAGLDAFLAAKQVGPQGKVVGLDMTPEMIETATRNAERAGITNVEFRLGDAESMPVGDATCDWIISNCVINLAPDKGKVFAEAFRVLKPGGRLMVSDIVTHDLPDYIRRDMAAWAGCIGGALEEEEYLDAIRGAGFEDVRIVGKVAYGGAELAGRASSVRVSAVKP
ncbi:MAG: arsenite methyltransferase [Armatimonadota bacterium]